MKRKDWRFDLGFALLLTLTTFAVYWPVLRAGFIWDDDGHVTKPALQSLHGLYRIWFEIGASQQYYPVLHSAFWVEHRLWGQNPLGYHLLNLCLHVLAALLFARVVYRIVDSSQPPGVRRGIAYLSASLFALHPVEVETVAWVSEQKNTLSAVFYLCAALAYFRFDARRDWRWYALSCFGFLLAVLSKSVTATLPAALLVVFWYRRGRLEWRRDWLPLLPWFPVAGVMAWVTGMVERHLIGAEGPSFAMSWAQRFVLSGRTVWFYVGKAAWPLHLCFNYPRWTIDARSFAQALGLLGAVLLVAALWAVRRWNRAPLAACLFFGGTLFPALGFFNVYPFIYSYVADHFQYLADLGLCALAGAALVRLATLSMAGRFAAGAAAGAILGAFAVLGHAQVKTYRDDETLYRTTVERNPASGFAWTNLGMIHYNRGDLGTAMADYRKALAANPRLIEPRNDLGVALADLGQWNAAIAEFGAALKERNPFPQAEINLGRPLLALGRIDEAYILVRDALHYQPENSAGHLSLGRILHLQGHYEEAIREYRISIGEEPALPGAWNFLGASLLKVGKTDEAMADFAEAIRLRPMYPDAHYNLALALEAKNRFHEAVQQLVLANKYDPNRADIYREIARLMRQSGHPDDAVRFDQMGDKAAALARAQAAKE